MTETELIAAPVSDTDVDSSAGSRRSRTASRRADGLNGLVLAELRTLAGQLGIRGVSGMRKGDLISAIEAQQGGTTIRTAPVEQSAPSTLDLDVPAQEAASDGDADAGTRRTRGRRAVRRVGAPDEAAGSDVEAAANGTDAAEQAESHDNGSRETVAADHRETVAADRTDSAASRASVDTDERPAGADREAAEPAGRTETGDDQQTQGRSRRERQGRRDTNGRDAAGRDGNGRDGNGRDNGRGRAENGDSGRRENDSAESGPRDNAQSRDNGAGRGDSNRGDAARGDSARGDDEESGRGRRGRRFRERRRGRDRETTTATGNGNDTREPEVREDDVLQPVAGILDVLDNYAFVRTSGYSAGPNDVYVSMNMVRKNGLRRGDAITGAVRAGREGEQQNQRQKFNPLVRLDSINGLDAEAARKRPEFNKLTPLYPNQRLRLETQQNILTTRVIDLIMPIGKGQRALIVSPPKAGKTTVLQDIANAIAVNNPECHLMVVLVDERPEEVTDMQRSVKGEVIASTFDRPPADHTAVAELAIERAKRLVEAGRDVVVLLDSITRLGRAYNNSSPASGRILSGGVDSTALYPPKRFLGAARNIENGGSLTIIASALVETGSTGDTVIFEEFKGTGNAELKLDRKIAERRVFPAIDVNLSSTRKDELLMSPDEFAVVHKLRRVLSGLDTHQAIDLLIDRLKKSRTNIEFLMQVTKTAPGSNGED
ncbi:transcription termination factor Rho [Millisia brevis]|uniref:transcription termination factor Rho n=1 Tax=Millisia brevis TaxID=264148 RepID=UPI000A0251C2|nr:transcription termination factor Rho [Millisia brevis]